MSELWELVAIEASSQPRRPFMPESLLSRLRKTLRGGRREQALRFQTILELAGQLDGVALLGLVRLLGRVTQGRCLANWTAAPNHQFFGPRELLFPTSIALTKSGQCLDDLAVKVKWGQSLSLATDVVLPWPWKPSRLQGALDGLVPGGSWGEWTQDDNHSVIVWLPLRIGWVHGGNHSIAAGIAHGTGHIMPRHAYDVSPVFEHVRCDGISFRREYDGKLLAPVTDLEMAAIFEIGRQIKKSESLASCSS